MFSNSSAAMHRRQVGQSIPINVITATFLDPKRYSKFINIWTYLGVLYALQYVQYLTVNNKSEEWERKLKNWIRLIELWKGGELKKYDWFSFKYDYLPQSIYSSLATFSKAHLENKEEEIQLPPNVVMGASFVNSLQNIVFDEHGYNSTSESDGLSNVLQIETVNYNDNTPEKMAEQVTEMIMEKYDKLKQFNEADYQLYFARHLPPWKSRFILQSPPDETLPTRDELEAALDKETLSLETKGEQPHEFDKYLFDDFLTQMDPLINHPLDHLGKRGLQRGGRSLLLNTLRVNYILQDIEQDRRRIIRNAIESMKTL